MKNLSWFPARDLAVAEKRAIRREGWRFWLLYRFKVWIISELVAETTTDTYGNITPTGKMLERRRVVQAAVIGQVPDFGDNEFMAKDWTDEPWDGGTFPPCTANTPATALVGSVTGGTGAFTFTDACAGEGEGGGVPPPYVPILDDVLGNDLLLEVVCRPGFLEPVSHGPGTGQDWWNPFEPVGAGSNCIPFSRFVIDPRAWANGIPVGGPGSTGSDNSMFLYATTLFSFDEDLSIYDRDDLMDGLFPISSTSPGGHLINTYGQGMPNNLTNALGGGTSGGSGWYFNGPLGGKTGWTYWTGGSGSGPSISVPGGGFLPYRPVPASGIWSARVFLFGPTLVAGVDPQLLADRTAVKVFGSGHS